MPKGEDSSVQIGANANIRDSAIGRDSSVAKGGATTAGDAKRKPFLIVAASVIGTIIIGWVTNALYDWTAAFWHLFGHGSK